MVMLTMQQEILKPVVSNEALARCLGEASCDYLEG